MKRELSILITELVKKDIIPPKVLWDKLLKDADYQEPLTFRQELSNSTYFSGFNYIKVYNEQTESKQEKLKQIISINYRKRILKDVLA